MIINMAFNPTTTTIKQQLLLLQLLRSILLWILFTNVVVINVSVQVFSNSFSKLLKADFLLNIVSAYIDNVGKHISAVKNRLHVSSFIQYYFTGPYAPSRPLNSFCYYGYCGYQSYWHGRHCNWWQRYQGNSSSLALRT